MGRFFSRATPRWHSETLTRRWRNLWCSPILTDGSSDSWPHSLAEVAPLGRRDSLKARGDQVRVDVAVLKCPPQIVKCGVLISLSVIEQDVGPGRERVLAAVDGRPARA